MTGAKNSDCVSKIGDNPIAGGTFQPNSTRQASRTSRATDAGECREKEVGWGEGDVILKKIGATCMRKRVAPPVLANKICDSTDGWGFS